MNPITYPSTSLGRKEMIVLLEMTVRDAVKAALAANALATCARDTSDPESPRFSSAAIEAAALADLCTDDAQVLARRIFEHDEAEEAPGSPRGVDAIVIARSAKIAAQDAAASVADLSASRDGVAG